MVLNKVSTVDSTPSGEFYGSMTVLGYEINVNLKFSDDMKLDFELTGAETVSCPSETYTIASDGLISLPGLNTAGDCLHDNMQGGVTLKGVKFDSATDKITITAKYSFFTETMVLNKVSTVDSTPSGEFYGSMTVLGYEINVNLKFSDDMKLDFELTGAETVSCPSETYTIASDGLISLPGLNTAGDCLHDNMQGGVTLKGVKFDSANDKITITAKYSFFTETLTLSKVQKPGQAPLGSFKIVGNQEVSKKRKY